MFRHDVEQAKGLQCSVSHFIQVSYLSVEVCDLILETVLSCGLFIRILDCSLRVEIFLLKKLCPFVKSWKRCRSGLMQRKVLLCTI